MKNKISAKAFVWIVSVILLVTIATGATVAFLIDQSPSLENSFVPVAVSCRVQENFDPTTNVKSTVSVKNTGDIASYIRAAVVVTWVSQEKGTTYGGAPVAGEHYTATFSDNGWIKGEDGFYYCETVVPAGEATPILLESIAPIAEAAPDGYVLSVQIVASAIQADPTDAVALVWQGIAVNENSTLYWQESDE